jgi:hypothetical protein
MPELTRKPYPSDVSDEEWALVAPYLALLPEDSRQRRHCLREVFNAMALDGARLRAVLRLADDRAPQPNAIVLDARALQSSGESGSPAGYDGAKQRRGSKVHLAVGTLCANRCLCESRRPMKMTGPRCGAGSPRARASDTGPALRLVVGNASWYQAQQLNWHCFAPHSLPADSPDRSRA